MALRDITKVEQITVTLKGCNSHAWFTKVSVCKWYCVCTISTLTVFSLSTLFGGSNSRLHAGIQAFSEVYRFSERMEKLRPSAKTQTHTHTVRNTKIRGIMQKVQRHPYISLVCQTKPRNLETLVQTIQGSHILEHNNMISLTQCVCVCVCVCMCMCTYQMHTLLVRYCAIRLGWRWDQIIRMSSWRKLAFLYRQVTHYKELLAPVHSSQDSTIKMENKDIFPTEIGEVVTKPSN